MTRLKRCPDCLSWPGCRKSQRCLAHPSARPAPKSTPPCQSLGLLAGSTSPWERRHNLSINVRKVDGTHYQAHCPQMDANGIGETEHIAVARLFAHMARASEHEGHAKARSNAEVSRSHDENTKDTR